MSPKEKEKLRPFNLKHCILVKAVIWEYKNNKKLHSVGKNLIPTVRYLGTFKNYVYSNSCAAQCFCFLSFWNIHLHLYAF